MTGAVNLNSNRNSILTTMAISRPLKGEKKRENQRELEKVRQGLIKVDVRAEHVPNCAMAVTKANIDVTLSKPSHIFNSALYVHI